MSTVQYLHKDTNHYEMTAYISSAIIALSNLHTVQATNISRER